MIRKLILLFLLLLSLAGNTRAQWYGNGRTLGDLNKQELDFLAMRTRATHRAGMVLAIGGTSASVVGVIGIYLFAITDVLSAITTGSTSVDAIYYDVFAGLCYLGAASTLAGIPLWVIGTQHHHVIMNQLKQYHPGTTLQLKPCLIPNTFAHGCSGGVSLSLRF